MVILILSVNHFVVNLLLVVDTCYFLALFSRLSFKEQFVKLDISVRLLDKCRSNPDSRRCKTFAFVPEKSKFIMSGRKVLRLLVKPLFLTPMLL